MEKPQEQHVFNMIKQHINPSNLFYFDISNLLKLIPSLFYLIGKIFLLITATFIFNPSIHSQEKDLLAIYQQALSYDASLSSAKFQNEATHELIAQGRSLFLPSINVKAGYDENDNQRKIYTNIDNALLSGTKADFNSYDYGITITQPLFDYSAFAKYQQILTQTSLADKQLIYSQQDLMYRISLFYFECLMAKDQVDLLQSQRASIQEQLLQAEAKYDAGLISVIDINEAKTKAALVEAQQIAAIHQYKIKKRQIQSLTGELPGKLKALSPTISFEQIDTPIETWISIAKENSLELRIKEDEILIADREIDIKQAGHYPTIDAIASRSRNWDKGGYPYGEAVNEGVRSFSDVLGVQINIPIFSGGFTSSKVREAKLLKNKVEQDAEYLRRQVELRVRENYLNLKATFEQIKSYKQALEYSRLQLESTKIGFNEDLRNSVDILVAQQVFFNARKDILESRYNYLMNLINLKLSVGILTMQDLSEINQYLITDLL
ncbi:TolC family outer membrane protein [Methylophilaceae bacterium]|nr:TolC family outer membrane protein [Methylophilaceae bacterium]